MPGVCVVKPIEIRDLLKYRFLSAPAFSPDGEKVCFVVTQADEEKNDYTSTLWLHLPAAGRTFPLTGFGEEKRFVWLDDHRLLFPSKRSEKEKQDGELGFETWYCLDLNGGEAQPFLRLPLHVSTLLPVNDRTFFAVAPVHPDCPDFANLEEKEQKAWAEKRKEEKDYEVLDRVPFYFNGRGFVGKTFQALFRIDLDPLRITRLTDGTTDILSARLQENRIVLATRPVRETFELYGFSVRALSVPDLTLSTLLDAPQLMFDTLVVDEAARENGIYLLASEGRRFGCNENPWLYAVDEEQHSLRLVSAIEGSVHPEICSDVRWDEDNTPQVFGGELYLIRTLDGRAELHAVSLTSGEDRAVVTEEGSMDILALSKTGRCAAVCLYGMGLQELWDVDLKTGSVAQATHLNTALQEAVPAKPQPLSVTHDGVTIGGWVLAPEHPAPSCPAILDIHGGPKCAYGPVFFHEMQVWAGMGYYVFFCNPRGSDGRDNAFADIRGKYGTIDYDDLMAFTDAVLEQYPQIDRKRVCVTGGSYGGFMTNWIIGHTDRFVCAASQRSISNWLSFAGVSDIGTFFVRDQTGADLSDPDALWAQSPLRCAPDVKTPTLFIHADEDYRCPLEQGLQMFTALKQRGVETRLCLFHGENHELSRSGKPKHRIRRLQEITDWFEKHTKG